jgi:phenylacetic acid degradation operon negative regulatory protein
MIRPQSMMFTLFGDYIMHRGAEIWVGSLIRIAAQFGLSEQAVRSALSRMSQKGWLKVRRVGNRPYYGPTARTRRLLEEGERRIFRRGADPWDRQWRILVYSIPERKREIRTELRKQLAWLGYGPLSSGSWICPHEVSADLGDLFDRLGIASFIETFTAAHTGHSTAQDLAARCWDLAGINRRYEQFLMKWEPMFEAFQQRDSVPDSECFVQRFMLIHEYRKFFFIDPELPTELLPYRWHGRRARELFHAFHGRLAEPANRFFDSVFEAPPQRRRRSGTQPTGDSPALLAAVGAR